MSLPRLPEAATPYTIEITVNTRLRPYFEWWYTTTKLPGETPQHFALRKLKDQVAQEYLNSTLPAQRQEIVNQITMANDAVQQDIETFKGEVE